MTYQSLEKDEVSSIFRPDMLTGMLMNDVLLFCSATDKIVRVTDTHTNSFLTPPVKVLAVLHDDMEC